MKFAVGFTVSARGDELRALARLAGSDDQAKIRQWLREESERAVKEHFARRGVNLRMLIGETATLPRAHPLPRLDESAQVVH